MQHHDAMNRFHPKSPAQAAQDAQLALQTPLIRSAVIALLGAGVENYRILKMMNEILQETAPLVARKPNPANVERPWYQTPGTGHPVPRADLVCKTPEGADQTALAEDTFSDTSAAGRWKDLRVSGNLYDRADAAGHRSYEDSGWEGETSHSPQQSPTQRDW